MKKNKMMRLASCLLVLVMLSTSMISGTFAKYVTTGSAEDTARVAKFGVTVTADGEGTFTSEYATDDTSFTLDSRSVVATEDVLAPGTEGVFAKFAIAGEPEVAVRVAYTVDKFDLGDNWKDKNDKYYCPIEITVGTDTLKGTDYESADAFEAAVKEKIVAFKADYAVGADLSTAIDPSISWAWAFEGNDDEKDTDLGDAANATIEIVVRCTVTQID